MTDADEEPPPVREVGRFEWEQAFRAAAKGEPLTVAVVAVGLMVATWSTTTTGGDVRPAQDTVREALGVHRATVARALGTLVRLGWLSVVARHPKRPTVYRLTVPGGSQQCEPSQQCDTRVATVRHEGRSSATGPVHRPCTDTSTLNALEPVLGARAWALVEAEEALAAAEERRTAGH